VPPDAATPFPHEYVLSLGFLIILVVAIPLGYFNLDDNIVVQQVACLALWVIVGKPHSFLFSVLLHYNSILNHNCWLVVVSRLDNVFRLSWIGTGGLL
jgi:hypothetical protein